MRSASGAHRLSDIRWGRCGGDHGQSRRERRKATESRRQYLYRQVVVSSLVRANGEFSRKERREYEVFPGGHENREEAHFAERTVPEGEKTIPYSEAGSKAEGTEVDGDLMRDLTAALVDYPKSRDGIPHSLFPLRTKDLPGYRFTLGRNSTTGADAHTWCCSSPR